MPQTQKSSLRFVRAMLRERIPSGRWNELNRQRLTIEKQANLFNLCLLSEQPAGIIAAAGALAFFKIFNQDLLRGLLGNEILHRNAELVNTAYDAVLYIVYMSIPILLILFFGRIHLFQTVPVRRVRRPWLLLPAIPVTLALYLIGEFLTGILIVLLRQVHLNAIPVSMPSPPTNKAALVVFCIQLCVLAPIMEEFLFRGLIQQRLLRYGAPFAIFTSSVLFAMLHGNLAQMVFAFIVGLALGFFAYRFQSIWASVILHACVNGTSIAIDSFSAQIKMLLTHPLLTWACVAGGLLLLFVCMLIFYLSGFYETLPGKAAEQAQIPLSGEQTQPAGEAAVQTNISEESVAYLPFSVAARAFFATPGFIAFSAVTVALVLLVLLGLA